jgi:hypothetical protein
MNLFAALDHEWKTTTRDDKARQRLASWAAAEPDLAGFACPRALVDHIRQPGHPEHSDRLLATLTRVAATDPAAARVALQALIPGLRRVATSLRTLDDPADIDAAVVAHAFERIRTYPLDTRPAHIAANIVRDTRKRVLRAHTTPRHEVLTDVREQAPQPCAGEELLRLVHQAVHDGRVGADGAWLIIRTRVHGDTLDNLATTLGQTFEAVRKRRLRAEQQLRPKPVSAPSHADEPWERTA